MSKATRPEDLESRLADLTRRLEVQERRARVPNISTLVAGLRTNVVATSETTSSAAYTDLTTVGPVVQSQVTGTGRLLILAGAEIAFECKNSAGGDGGRVGYQITGVLNGTLGPFDLLGMSISSVPLTTPVDVTTSFVVVVENLIVEQVDVTLKYLARSGATAPATFAHRTLSVLPL